MSVLGRLLGWVLLAGLALGVVLRLTLGRRRFGALLTAFLLVPAALHAGYVLIHALGHGAAAVGALAYLLGAALVIGTGVLLARRWLVPRALWAALLPFAAGAVYAAVPFALYSWSLRRHAIDLDIVPTALFLGACVFGTALLVPFVPGGTGGGWFRGLFRRR